MPAKTQEDFIAAALEQVQEAVKNGQMSAACIPNLERWLTEPYYAEYVPQILDLVNTKSFGQLDTLFWQVLPFGTGGRRGLMAEFGSATVNARTIAESAHGLAVYLKSVNGEKGGRAVVTSDTRNRSVEFAKITASTLAAHGLQVFIFESCRSTPELSFAVRHLNCDVGVMISASHNPPSDNGFKAYWSTGGQVLSPHDRGIIDCVAEAGDIPKLDFKKGLKSGSIVEVGEKVDKAYVAEVLKLSLSTVRELPVLFTPLHGVGETSAYAVLQQAGFIGLEMFEPQREPNGDFPNVPDQLPNPERAEVFAPAIEHAVKSGAELILACDPDADRLGVCVRDSDGQFVHLSGNRIGVLLVDYILRKRSAAGTLTSGNYVVETLVTTPLISEIAKSYDVRAIDDLLVGFKYIGQTMDQKGPKNFVFGAEESLGYLVGTYARDKDASIAALYLAECAAELKQSGQTLLDRLDELYQQFGYFYETQSSQVCTGSKGREQIDFLMTQFRENPPTGLGEVELQRVKDYNLHEVRRLPENVKTGELPKPEGDLMFFEAESVAGKLSLAVRPSGTEPKIKFYFFSRTAAQPAEELFDIKQQTEFQVARFADNLQAWIAETLNNFESR